MPEKVDTLRFLAISPDSKWIASVPERGEELTLWLASECSCQALCRPGSRITAITFSSNSESLASADKAQNVLDVGRSLISLSFSPDDLQLRTSFGDIAIEKSVHTSQAISPALEDDELENTSVILRRPRWQGYGIDVSGKWITWNGVNIIFLPADINPSSNLNYPRWDDGDLRYQVAAGDFVVAWAGPSGELYTMGFSRDIDPFD
ncbi:pfs domain-containing protein [Colletotrichum kahawae]|uniref:Pfs domain-containing protein n=1 Tax=Colletotrichum kahawae TaxID=34407 RepID=A0AAE0DDU7_COLKA|nr:pfs domain-containing protein [Colletotrichum kahawae]